MIKLPGWLRDLKPRNLGFPAPEIEPFIHTIDLQGQQALDFVEQYLVDNGDSLKLSQEKTLRNLLRNAREFSGSLTKRVFQELVLGSKQFEESYKRRGRLDTQSYLTLFDEVVLEPDRLQSLLDWLSEEEHSAGIFTNRPDRLQKEFFSTPEAEMGSQLVGLERFPIIGSGSLSAAALTHKPNGPIHAFFKPSAVHVLSAIQLALGATLGQALANSISLVRRNGSQSNWKFLDQARVIVVEDTSGGLKSGLSAQRLLQAHGIELEVSLVGIAEHTAKAKALREVGADVFEDVNFALQKVI